MVGDGGSPSEVERLQDRLHGCFPLLLFAGVLLQVDNLSLSGRHLDVLGHSAAALAFVLMSIPGQVLRQWVEETDRRDDYLMAGPFMSAFADYSLRRAGWDWPWFNRVRTSVLILGLACWAVALSGSALFGWS